MFERLLACQISLDGGFDLPVELLDGLLQGLAHRLVQAQCAQHLGNALGGVGKSPHGGLAVHSNIQMGAGDIHAEELSSL